MLPARNLNRLANIALRQRSAKVTTFQAVRFYDTNAVVPTLPERIQEGKMHMDHLPSPTGDYMVEYNKRQAKYNLNLMVAIGAVIASCIAGQLSGWFWNPWLNTKKPLNIYDPKWNGIEEAEE